MNCKYKFLLFIFEPVDDKKCFSGKIVWMKLIRIFAIFGILVFVFSCGNQDKGLNVINSESFPEKNITLDSLVTQRLIADSVVNTAEQNHISDKLDEMIRTVEKLRKNQSDSLWNKLSASWYDFGKADLSVLSADSLSDSGTIAVAEKWVDLNIALLKLSGEVKFGDAIEDLLYKFPRLVLTEKQLKSIMYTHIDDRIFINEFGSSSFNYQHTTGGNVRLIQQTDYPLGNEMILICEVADVRYMDVFIRIPSWAVNPTVTHGNVKYVARPGEYCEIYRKWNNGDEIQVRLKN